VEKTNSKPNENLYTFFLKTKKTKQDSDLFKNSKLIPGLFYPFRILKKIRYDYPAILVNNSDNAVISLTQAVNRILKEIAPDKISDERLRQNVLKLEFEIKKNTNKTKSANLSESWKSSKESLIKKLKLDDENQKIFDTDIKKAVSALDFDGDLIECGKDSSYKIIYHLWNQYQKTANEEFIQRLDKIIYKLSGILISNKMKSKGEKKPQALKVSFGKVYESEFDFDALSGIITGAFQEILLTEKRKKRIKNALSILENQKFFPVSTGGNNTPEKSHTYSFQFQTCKDALDFIDSKRMEMIDFIKALYIAELEIENKYIEQKHEPYFENFDNHSLNVHDFIFFPSFLICISNDKMNDDGRGKLFGILSSKLPIKILFLTDEIFNESILTGGRNSFNGWNSKIALMAVNLSNAFVMQTTNSNLIQEIDSISEGIKFRGPSLFSIYNGISDTDEHVPYYMTSAAALESRAFPSFKFNPQKGNTWEEKFTIISNNQIESDFPENIISWEDDNLQLQTQKLFFTLTDFLAVDPRFSGYFKLVTRENWTDNMIPLGEYLKNKMDISNKLPYIIMADAKNTLFRVLVNRGLIDLTLECAENWRNLQEMGGVNNSFALNLLAEEKKKWDEEKEKELKELREKLGKESPAGDAAGTAAVSTEEVAVEAVEEERPVEEAYINTPRCTTCNDCTERNPQMFAYNENKQAYIKDITAGTFRQLVEAAENCPVAIIHPGIPINPDEPGLDELIKRAEPFN
jgi:ferredoxin